MQFKGRLISWNEQRGFGFITPLQKIAGVPGAPEIFIHIKAFSPRSVRPLPGQQLMFTLERDTQGKLRAKTAELMGVPRQQARQPSRPPAARTGLTYAMAALPLITLLLSGLFLLRLELSFAGFTASVWLLGLVFLSLSLSLACFIFVCNR